jgi:hypothetical protein
VASLAVVERLGFRRTGTQIDEIDGEEWVFELSLRRARTRGAADGLGRPQDTH